MPGVPEPGGAHPSIPALTAHQELANQQAAKLLDMFTAARPMNPDAFVPGYGMPGGADVPKPHGLFTSALIDPDVWPTESESELGRLADQLGQLARNHESAADSAKAQADAVFSGSWTAGEGSDAAYEHYQSQYGKQLRLADALRDGAGGVGRLGEDIRRTKRLMREAHDDAHRDIEAFLKSN